MPLKPACSGISLTLLNSKDSRAHFLVTTAWLLDHSGMLFFCHSLINILAWVLVLLSHVWVPNKGSYRPKTVTLDPSPACVGTGSIWIFIGISTSFFSFGHFFTYYKNSLFLPCSNKCNTPRVVSGQGMLCMYLPSC